MPDIDRFDIDRPDMDRFGVDRLDLRCSVILSDGSIGGSGLVDYDTVSRLNGL
jgi:hypothetical protein